MKAKVKSIKVRGKRYLIAQDIKGKKIAFQVEGLK